MTASGDTLLGTDQAQSQPAAQSKGASALFQQPASETQKPCLASQKDPLPADGHLAEPKVAVRSGANLSANGPAPGVDGTPASSHSFQVPASGPHLQPVLKQASRFSQQGQARTDNSPVACFSASAAVKSQKQPGNDTQTCHADSTAAAAATKHSSGAQHHSANATTPCPAKITKQRKTAAASAKRQQQQQAQLPVAKERFDCQQLKLLPQDVVLHSECMARMQRKSAEPSQASRYIQRASLADQSAQAIGEDNADPGAPDVGKRHLSFGLASVFKQLCAGFLLQHSVKHFCSLVQHKFGASICLLCRLCASQTICFAGWSRGAGLAAF